MALSAVLLLACLGLGVCMATAYLLDGVARMCFREPPASGVRGGETALE